MATKIVKEYSAFFEGIADFPKTGGPASYQLGRSVDHRTDTRSLQLLPKTIKKSGSVVTDLVKWATTVPLDPFPTYLYGNTGNLYLRDSSSNYSFIHQVDNSHGNGLGWFGEDKFLYLTSDDQVGRYGSVAAIGGNNIFYPDLFVGANANTCNTAALSNLLSLSQYAYTPSAPANQITGDLSIFVNVRLNAPLGGANTITLVSKDDFGANQRAYNLELIGIDADNFTISLILSNDGTNTETYNKNVNITGYASLNRWLNIGVTWNHSTHVATFYVAGVSKGTDTHAFSSIFASTAPLSIAANRTIAGSSSGYVDGCIDNVSLWDVVITGATTPNITDVNFRELQGTETGLRAYYKLNNNYLDSSTNNNTLIPIGTAQYENRFQSTFDDQNINVEPAGLNNAQYPPFPTPTTARGSRPDIDLDGGTIANTYTIPTAVIEDFNDNTNRLLFTPTKDPQKSIAVRVNTVGTGDFEVIIHDNFNGEIAHVKYPVGTLQATGYFEINYLTMWSPVPGATYHAHFISTVADTKLQVTTAGDLSSAWFRTFFGFLLPDTQYHPISTIGLNLVVGNGNYVATLQATVYDPNTIQLPFGWKVRCFSYWNEYLAIGAWMGDTVDAFDRGRIFFWDGASLTYNFFIDVPEGAINSMVGSKGQLWFIAGSRCKLMLYEGGARAAKIKNLVNSENGNVIDVYPGAMSMWRLLLRFGVAGNSADTVIQEGVYTWGTVNERYPESLSFDYVISTGNYQGTNVHIGMVQAALNKLLIGWQDNTTYGVDEVAVGNDPFATGTVQFLIEDDGAMYHQKEAITVTTQFEPLTSGQSLTLKYRFDRNASFTSLPAITTVGQTTSRDVIATGVKRYREYEVGLDLATSSSSSPVVLAVGIEKDVLETEKRVG